VQRQRPWLAAAGAALGAALLVAAVIVVATLGWRARYRGEINQLGVDLARPHAYVATPALSRLPRDLIQAPVLRELLTEDFAFYYEEHEERLSLEGAVRRIAFEHDTTLLDKLVAVALDEPAEVAMWADAKGAPRHWLIAMTRGVIARALHSMATVAAKDSQLSVIADLPLNGESATVYALTLSPRRTLALVAQGERVVVLSHPGLLFDAQRRADERARDVVEALLSPGATSNSPYRRSLGLGAMAALGSGHQIVADGRLLSFGYQHFFPGLQALRFDLGAGGASLHTRLRVAQADALPQAGPGPWPALPINPAACALLPADWAQVKGVASRAKADAQDKAAWAALAGQLEGPAAICWYAASQMHTPLLVAQAKAGAAVPDQALEALADWLLPADAPQAVVADRPGAKRWQREVTADWGPRGRGDATSYRPTLARQGRWIAFSPDDKLAERALDAQERRYPSLADALPKQGATLAVLVPAQIATLLQREAFQVLPPEKELFRQAAQQHLVPRLDALRKLDAARAVARGAPDAQGWVEIDWQPFDAAGKGQP
jgi:uncharacterized protein YfaA (DUF2138 family)